MHSRSLVCAVALTIAFTAQFAYGQGRARGHVVPLLFQEMDTNHDGIVTRAEWRGTAASFRVHDLNRDGVLSGDELRIGRGRGHQAQTDAADFDSAYREYDYNDWTAQGFAGLDHNRDNRFTRDEWHFAMDSFVLADHDHNGWLSRAEFLGEDSLNDDRTDHFRYLDTNNDGRVSRSEWHGALLLFNAMDRNRDGYLTPAETIGNEPPTDLFTSVDVNGDGTITIPEWHWSRQSFDQRDANKDGRLTAEEFRGVLTPNANTAAYRAGYDRGVIEGRAAGREDRQVNHYWDLEGQRELETADSGYQPSVGPKEQYQAGYREGFRKAYPEGWNRPTTQ
jgi:Ca2+-binding EF-hand superfamily protein